MKKPHLNSLFLVLLLVTGANGLEYFMHGTQFSWQAQARLWLADGKVVEGTFTVSDPWLVVLPKTQSHTVPFFWQDIAAIEMKTGGNAVIKMADGTVVATNFIYGIASGDRLYFYAGSNLGTKDVYAMIFNEREKPTPEFIHIRKVEFVATPQINDPVVFSNYR